MLKFIIAFVVLFSLSACTSSDETSPCRSSAPTEPAASPYTASCENDPHMSNAEIIAESNLCTSAGLDAKPLQCGTNPGITRIQCTPK